MDRCSLKFYSLLLFHLCLWQLARLSSVCQTGQVRLAGGSSYLEGRVEYCQNGVWGTVCDDEFDENDASVTCRQLGFSSAGAQFRDSARPSFGQGSGGIFLTNLDCTGAEDSLGGCPSLHQCGHFEDVGVICQNNATSARDVSLYYKARKIANNSWIALEMLTGEPLHCVTPLPSCCTNSPSSSWYAPTSTSPSPISSIGETQSLLYQNRSDDGSVRLHAKNDSGSFTGGIHRCVIPDREGRSQELFVGIYSSNGGSISRVDLQLDRLGSALTCRSEGGPATSVSWTKDGFPIEVDGRTYVETQVVKDMASATYENRLVFAVKESRYSGSYRCTVGNSRGSLSSEVQITVCRSGELRTNSETLEICSQNTWIPVESTAAVQTSENVVENLVVIASGSLVQVSWTADASSVSTYDVSCSNSKSSFIAHAPSSAKSATLSLTLESSAYECCITAHLPRKLENFATFYDRQCKQLPSVGSLSQPVSNQSSYLTFSLIGLIVVLVICTVSVAVGCICVLVSKRNYQKSHPERTLVDIKTANSFLVDNPIYKTTGGSVASLNSDSGVLTNGSGTQNGLKPVSRAETSHSSAHQSNGHVISLDSKLALAPNPQYGTVDKQQQQQPPSISQRYVRVTSDSEPDYEILPEAHQERSNSMLPPPLRPTGGGGSGPDPIYSLPTALNQHPSHQSTKPEFRLPVYESTTDLPATTGKDGAYAKLNHGT